MALKLDKNITIITSGSRFCYLKETTELAGYLLFYILGKRQKHIYKKESAHILSSK